ncbi:hypothetical protein [Mycobacterium simiae]|uniref:hypothetical protein n=1 Tax=Mycobacterium simiae TaxID=1784 RepID=UPI0026032951|nr:hypothetical protein [Mycobacterium simiae]
MSAADSFKLGMELASGVMLLVDYAVDRRRVKQLAADSARAAELLTNLHREEFPNLTPPRPPVAQRRWRRLWTTDTDEQAAEDRAHEENLKRWKLLCDHDCDEVVVTVDTALADNASQSTCVDAGTGPAGNYVTLVVQYPGPEIAEGVVQAGAKTRPRTEKEKADLYQRAVASTVIATAKEALACAPAADEANVLVLRYDMRSRFKKQTPQIDAIYAGALDRRVLKIDWSLTDPVTVMLGARETQIRRDRKGRLEPLGDYADDDVRELVAAIAAARDMPPRDRPLQRRYTKAESKHIMQFQLGDESDEFAATCTCPSCGEIDTHTLRQPESGDPSWATVIRVCAVCKREWAQR